RNEILALLDTADQFKRGAIAAQPLAGRSVALVFFNPSLRTRASMQVGIYELGGNAVTLEPGGGSWTLEHRDGTVMDADKTEHVAEFVRVLGRYCAAVGVRSFAALQNWGEERNDPVLRAFARHADVVYAKSWGGKNFYGNPEADIVQRAQYRRKWIVDEAKMSRTNDALFMHCLPVRRNVIVSDEVIDSVQSVVIDEAENRLHIQKAMMAKLLEQ